MLSYPTSLQTIGKWAAEHKMTVAVAKFRFVQYGVLQAVAGSHALSQVLAFKGGNALDFVWQPNRSTKDLDFSSKDSALTAEQIRTLLKPSLQRVSRNTGVLYRVQRMEQQPPGPDRSFITFDGAIGYGLPDDQRNRQLIEQDQNSRATVPLDINLNEPICSVVELDICVVVRDHPDLDLNLTAEFLLEKAKARDVPVSRAAFHQKEIEARASEGYSELKETARNTFVEFDEAFATVLGLVNRLPLPDQVWSSLPPER
jgi:hypothetical protein